jgi:serine/threonine-protein kinase
MLSFTPGYSAPERMTSAEVTTATDIYSLGKLLGKLIPPKPGEKELHAIIARATAADPLSRYPTADALGQDVQAWGRGLPVTAAGGGRWYPVRKFVGRHRLGVAAAAAAFILLSAALVLTLTASNRADRARAEAAARFGETRAIAKTMLFDTYDEVSKVPGSTRAREVLARTGLKYLDALASDPGTPLDVRVEAGLGYLRLAEVMGGGQASQLGRFEDGNALLGEAEKVLRPLWARHPDNADVRRAWASLLVEQAGVNLYNNNESALARRQAIEAQRVLEPIARTNAAAARVYATAVQAEGDSYGWGDDYAGARPVHQRAEGFIASLPPALQTHREIMNARSANLRLLGESHHKTGGGDAARAALDRAVDINRSLLGAAPDDPSILRKLTISLWYRAVVHRTNKRDRLARESIEEAVALARRLRDRDVNDAGGIQLFALTGDVQAQVLGDLGRYRESFAAGDEVLSAHRRLVELAENAPGALRSMAASLRTIGGNHYNGGDYPGACGSWRAAEGIYVALDRRGVLSELDRNNAKREVRDYLRTSCEGGPPRAGLGKAI